MGALILSVAWRGSRALEAKQPRLNGGSAAAHFERGKLLTSVSSIEKSVKEQFAKVFQMSDWPRFKEVGDYYLRQAAFLRKRDIAVPPKSRLLMRNSQKRLLIGIEMELLLKALYLKNGYAINRPTNNDGSLKFPFRFEDVVESQLMDDETFTLSNLIGHIRKVFQFEKEESVLRGLKVAKVFRNKEGHVVTGRHVFRPSNYRDIEFALGEVYRQGFGQNLTVRFSFEAIRVGSLAFWWQYPRLIALLVARPFFNVASECHSDMIASHSAIGLSRLRVRVPDRLT